MKKIMFNDKYGLTKAVLKGRKTMTRRVIKCPKECHGEWVSGLAFVKKPGSDEIVECFALDADGGMIDNILPKYKPGEVVAVAQSYHTLNKMGYLAPEWLDHTCEDSAGYDNKMFVRADLMPFQIRITNVRIERLQDISREDCLREGVFLGQFHTYSFVGRGRVPFRTPREAFAALIDKVSGKGTWESNPYVFVYEFELIVET